jgi:hypothetical protein
MKPTDTPDTWLTVKVGRTWRLTTYDGTVLECNLGTKKEAENLRSSGFWPKYFHDNLHRWDKEVG